MNKRKEFWKFILKGIKNWFLKMILKGNINIEFLLGFRDRDCFLLKLTFKESVVPDDPHDQIQIVVWQAQWISSPRSWI